MPIATPEVYAQMLDTAKQRGFAFPAINCTSSQTLNAALRGFADAESDGIVQISTGGAEYLSGCGQGHGDRRDRAGRVRARRRGEVPHPRRAAYRPLPEGQARRLHAPAGRDLAGAGRARRGAAVPVAHVGRLGGTAGREPADRRRTAGRVRGRPHHHGDGDRGGRRRGGRGRRRDQREAVHHAGGRAGDCRGARARRAGPVHAGRHVRQRARRLQAGEREAAPVRAEARSRRRWARSTARKSRSTWSSTAGRVRRWRRSGRRSPTAWSR